MSKAYAPCLDKLLESRPVFAPGQAAPEPAAPELVAPEPAAETVADTASDHIQESDDSSASSSFNPLEA